jgi:hypothetical protein
MTVTHDCDTRCAHICIFYTQQCAANACTRLLYEIIKTPDLTRYSIQQCDGHAVVAYANLSKW